MWNLASSNKLCADRFTALSHQKHMTNVQNVKKSINNSEPYIPTFLRSRAKQEKDKETRNGVIQYENKVLLDKMMEIERKKTELNPDIIEKKRFKPSQSLNTSKRARELRKINTENKALLKRLQSAHSVYSVDKWVDDDKKHVEFRENISRNARRNQHIDFSAISPKPLNTFYNTRDFEYQSDQPGMYYEY